MTLPFNNFTNTESQRSVEGMTPDKIRSTMVEAVQERVNELRSQSIDGPVEQAEGYRDDVATLVAALVHLIGSSEHAPDDFEFDSEEIQGMGELIEKMWLQVSSNNSTYSDQIEEGLRQIELTNQQLTRDVESLKQEIREGYQGDSEFLREEIDKIRDDVRDDVLATIVDGAPESMDTFAEAYTKFGEIKEHNEILTTALESKLDKSKVGTNVSAGVVVERASNGHVLVPVTPTANNHAAPKTYVDSEISKLRNTIPSGTNYVNALTPGLSLWVGTSAQYNNLSTSQKNDVNVIRVVRQ